MDTQSTRRFVEGMKTLGRTLPGINSSKTIADEDDDLTPVKLEYDVDPHVQLRTNRLLLDGHSDLDLSELIYMELFDESPLSSISDDHVDLPLRTVPSDSSSSQGRASTNSSTNSSSNSSTNGPGPSQFKFGRQSNEMDRHTIVYDESFEPAQFNNSGGLKYAMTVSDVPTRSRVETQIKVVLHIYPPPPQKFIHLPADTISKPKLQLRDPFVPTPNTLDLDAVVLCDGNQKEFANMCPGCINRERKRASRKKIRLPVEEAHWNDKRDKRVIVFNCKEVMDFGPIVEINVDGQKVQARQLSLPMRLACYCRHHNEKIGFKTFFTIRDHTGAVVARANTGPVMITDDHKAGPVMPSQAQMNSHLNRPLAPSEVVLTSPRTSISGDNSSFSESDGFNPRKRKMPYDGSSFSPTTTGPTNSPASGTPAEYVDGTYGVLSPPGSSESSTAAASPKSEFGSNAVNSHGSRSSSSSSRKMLSEFENGVLTPPQQVTDSWISRFTNFEGPVPVIKKVIPGSGSIRGGIEVTLLGTGFVNGLVAKFGDNKSIATHCWNGTTIVAHLPPAQIAGIVDVSFEGWAMSDSPPFRYYDDTDKQLIELALQVVGLKMNGRLEDAREIARRIIGDGGTMPDSLRMQLGSAGSRSGGTSQRELENLVIRSVDLVVMANSGFANDFDHCNAEGQTMLHLAAIMGMTNLVNKLIVNGAFIDAQDDNGFTSLHLAAMHDHPALVKILLDHDADPFLRTIHGQQVIDLAQGELKEYLSDEYLSDMRSVMSIETSNSPPRSAAHSRVQSRSHSRRPSIVHEPTTTRTFAGMIAEFRDNARNSANEFLRARGAFNDDVNFWNYFRPHAQPAPVAEVDSEAPPSYEEIFPQGASTAVDYSGSVVCDTKPVGATIREVPVETTTTTAPEEEDSEEVVFQAWKEKRKQLNNDKMLFFFWLPVFIFLLVWMSFKTVTYINSVDLGTAVKERVESIGMSIIRLGVSPRMNNVNVLTV